MRICFQLVGGIPVIGPVFHSQAAARRQAQRWLARFEKLPPVRKDTRVLIERRGGLYSLTVVVTGRLFCRLKGLDELLIQRLYREVRRKRVLVLTSFVGGSPQPQPLVSSEGLGLVVFQRPVLRP
uniref:Uncharacterized protein n=1 Tax=Ammonifex degensii TaxID=42838 RepID=A0A7C2E9Y3_9THEO